MKRFSSPKLHDDTHYVRLFLLNTSLPTSLKRSLSCLSRTPNHTHISGWLWTEAYRPTTIHCGEAERELRAICCSVNSPRRAGMSLQWEMQLEVSRRPGQVVYIRIKADISAFTYPNKRQAGCCLACTEGGDRGGRKIWKREKGEYEVRRGTCGSVPTMQSSSVLSPSVPKEKNTS